MARPAKAAKVLSNRITKEERAAQIAAEEVLRGSGGRIEPAYPLNDAQRQIFNTIVSEYEAAGILGNLDSYVLTITAVSIDRVAALDQSANGEPETLTEARYYSARGNYLKDFWRGCNELCLSPQSRAKIGKAAAQAVKERKDKLVELLADDDD
jgi:hypothetical protein